MDLEVTKDIENLDQDDILSCWRWRVPMVKSIIMVSCLGDLFLIGEDNAVYWLKTDCGDLIKAAETLDEFLEFLNDEEKVDNWFLPELINELIEAGKIIKENEVYSYKILPVIGGEYNVDNIEPTDISVHFAMSGQICEQIKDLPDGTKVRIKVKK
jgi:hypothetical protein